MEKYIQFKNIDKQYDNADFKTIDGLNLDIEKGDFVVMVGPSGCGKSTTLRMLAGLEDISGGDLVIDGNVVNDVEPQDRGISMVFQSYALYPHMTVEDNMGFSLKMKKVAKEERKQKVQKAAEVLGLVPYLNRKPKELSGGQRQRVALGRAIVRDAKVFLMDEPLSNLDAKLRTSMRAEILRIHRELNATTVYVSHDQIEAMTMATKIVVMNAGYIMQVGSPTEVFSNPDNKFVAGFIGTPTINFIDGTVKQNSFSGEVDITLDLPENINLDQEVTIGIRPNEFKIDNLSMQTYSPRFKGEITHKELIGHIEYLYVEVNGKSITLEVEHRQQYEIGDVIEFTANPSKIFIFDKETEERIR